MKPRFFSSKLLRKIYGKDTGMLHIAVIAIVCGTVEYFTSYENVTTTMMIPSMIFVVVMQRATNNLFERPGCIRCKGSWTKVQLCRYHSNTSCVTDDIATYCMVKEIPYSLIVSIWYRARSRISKSFRKKLARMRLITNL